MNLNKVKEQLEKLVKITNVDSNEYVSLEEPHIEADNILCELINEYVPNGKEIVNLYKQIDKWYA